MGYIITTACRWKVTQVHKTHLDEPWHASIVGITSKPMLDFSHISVTMDVHKLAPEMIIPPNTVKEIVVCLSTTENLEFFVDGLEGHQNLLLKENRPKGLVIVDLEMVAVKSCKSTDYSG